MLNNLETLNAVVFRLVDLITHETSHLLGYAHEIENHIDGPLFAVANTDSVELGEIVVFGHNGIKIDQNVEINSGFIASNNDITVDREAQVQGILGNGNLYINQSAIINGDIIVNGNISLSKNIVANGNIDGGIV